MALTLDAALATAQDSLNRQPLVELISTQIADAIPFDGQYFNDDLDTERKPNTIIGSTGQVFTVFIRDVSSTDQIIFLYTDVDKTFWTEASAILSTAFTISNLTLVELTNGNIGIIYTEQSGTTYYLKQITIDLEGTIISASSIIATYTTPITIKDPFVILLANNTYLLVYVQYGGIYYSIQKRTSSDFSSWSAESLILLDFV